MVKWADIDPVPITAYCLAYHKRYNAYPSIREIFYHFIDKLWPNTKSAYKTLSKWLVAQRLSKAIDWHIIRDGAGREYDEGDYPLSSPREHVSSWFNLFVDIGGRYNLPMWTDQPNKVIVACEKEADYPIVQSVLGSLNVDTFYERGYTGWRPLFETVEKLAEEKKNPVVLALGDFDPSGEDIVRFLKQAFVDLGIPNIRVVKICVTKKQIERFKLPHKPEDAQEIEKLKKDPRFQKWPYGLYRVETAALRDVAPDYFDKTLQDSVLKFFDQEIYGRLRQSEAEERAKITKFFEENVDLINDMSYEIEQSETLE